MRKLALAMMVLVALMTIVAPALADGVTPWPTGILSGTSDLGANP